jgi:hypothetical protein
MLKQALLSSVLLTVLGCGGSKAPAGGEPGSIPTVSAAVVESSAPVVAPTATASASATAAPTATPAAAPAKPASTWKIGGVSVSTVDAAGLKAPVEKAGYTIVGEPVKVICGDLETVQFNLSRKDKPVGSVTIQRAATKPAVDGCKLTNKDAFEKLKKASEKSKSLSGSFDEVGDVVVVVELLKDETGAAKKLHDALVTK